MTMKKSIVQQVGEKFVRLYYARLNQAPESLHKLYGKNSSYVHGGVDSEGRPLEEVYGQAEIHKRVMALNFKDCQTEIRCVDAHATVSESVVVQVMGELSTNMQPMRKFVQTLVLAPEGTKKFYIHNDVLHYQDEVFKDTESEVKVEDLEESVPSSTASSQPVVPQEEVAVSPKPEPEVEEDVEASVEQDVEASVEQDVEASVEQDVEASVEQDVEASVEQDIEASVEQDVEASVEEDVKASVEEDVEASVEQEVEASVKDNEVSVEQDVEASVEQDVEASVEKDIEASVEKDVEASVKDGEVSVEKDIEASVKDGETELEAGSSVPGSSVPVLVPPSSQLMCWATVTAKHLPPRGPVPVSVQKPLRRKVQRPGREGKQGEKEGRRVVQYSDAQQLFVGNLPQDMEKSELMEFFQQYGTVLEVNIIKGVKHPNFGFVVFDNSKSVKNVLSKEQIKFRGDIQLHLREKKTRQAQEGGVNGGGPRVVRYPDAQQLFVGNLPQDVEKSELTEFFQQYGTVLQVQIFSGVQRPNFGFVVFDHSKSVKNVLSNKQIKFRGDIQLHLREKKTRQAQEGGVNGGGPRVVRYPDAQQLFVGNLPQDVEKSELTEFFQQYGTVLQVQIHSSGGKHPNFGFVVFDNTEPIKNILRNKRLKFRGGVWLNVKERKTQPAQEGDRRNPRPHSGPDKLGGPQEQGVGEGGPRGPPTNSGKKDQVLDLGKVPGPTRPAAPPCARKAPNKSQRLCEPQQPIRRQSERKQSKKKV